MKALLIILIINAHEDTQEYRYPMEDMQQCMATLKASSTTRAHNIKKLGGGDFEDLDTLMVSMTCSLDDKSMDLFYANSPYVWDGQNQIYHKRKVKD